MNDGTGGNTVVNIETINLIAAILGGGLTVFFLERAVSWWNRPILQLSTTVDGCLSETPYIDPPSKRTLRAKYVRVCVENRGIGTAKCCRCYLLSGSRKGADGITEAFLDDPIDLVWSRKHDTETSIPGKLRRYFDVCRTLSDATSLTPAKKTLDIWANKWPLRLNDFFGPNGDYELCVAVASDNAPLVKSVLQFRFDGGWDQISINPT